MLRVAVCDNDSGDLMLAQQLLRRYFAERPLREYQIHPFASPRSLQAQLARGETYDLYVLDILMPEIDGIRIGRLVRQQPPLVGRERAGHSGRSGHRAGEPQLRA